MVLHKRKSLVAEYSPESKVVFGSLVVEHMHLILIAAVLVMKIQPKCHAPEPNFEAVY